MTAVAERIFKDTLDLLPVESAELIEKLCIILSIRSAFPVKK